MRNLPALLISERVVIAVIVINTLAIFLRGFPACSPMAQPLLVVDYICCVYFVVEMFLKIRLTGFRGYWSSGWNRFDFLVVLASSPLLLTPFLDAGDFAVLLILRTGRLMRFFRLLRFVPDAPRVWEGVVRGLKASVGIGLAIATYNLVLALAACYLFREVSPEYFGDPMQSFYSLFKVFTVEGWYEIPDTISAKMGPTMAWFTRAFFIFAVTTGGLLGLSMANAVFVDEMVMDNNDQLEADLDTVMARLDQIESTQSHDVRSMEAKLEDIKVLLEELREGQKK